MSTASRVASAANGGARRRPRRWFCVGAVTAISLASSGCGMFDTEYEPVKKGQKVEVNAGDLARGDNSGGGVPLPTAQPGVTRSADPSGVSGPSAATGSSAASGASGTKSGGTGDESASSGSPGTESGSVVTTPGTEKPVTTVTDAVIATVPHTTPAVPLPVPGSTTSTTAATRDFTAFCDASEGLIRLSHVFLDDAVNADLAYMSAQARAAGQYILNMADSYPLADRSAFDELIPAANDFIKAFGGFASVDQVRYAIAQFKVAHAAALTQIGEQQTRYCPEALNA